MRKRFVANQLILTLFSTDSSITNSALSLRVVALDGLLNRRVTRTTHGFRTDIFQINALFRLDRRSSGSQPIDDRHHLPDINNYSLNFY